MYYSLYYSPTICDPLPPIGSPSSHLNTCLSLGRSQTHMLTMKLALDTFANTHDPLRRLGLHLSEIRLTHPYSKVLFSTIDSWMDT